MKTPEEVIGADAVAALKAEGYDISEREPLFYPRPDTWTDSKGEEHKVEFHTFSYAEWRRLLTLD